MQGNVSYYIKRRILNYQFYLQRLRSYLIYLNCSLYSIRNIFQSPIKSFCTFFGLPQPYPQNSLFSSHNQNHRSIFETSNFWYRSINWFSIFYRTLVLRFEDRKDSKPSTSNMPGPDQLVLMGMITPHSSWQRRPPLFCTHCLFRTVGCFNYHLWPWVANSHENVHPIYENMRARNEFLGHVFYFPYNLEKEKGLLIVSAPALSRKWYTTLQYNIIIKCYSYWWISGLIKKVI